MRYTVIVDDINICETWHKENTEELHREKGPAYTKYCESGKIKQQEWYLNNLLHNENGPAVIKYNVYEKVNEQEWFLYGQGYTEEEYRNTKNKLNNSCDGKIVEIDGKKYKLTEV